MRTGRLSSRGPCNNEYRDILVRQLDDGTYEYLVGDSAVRRDGWCTLPAQELTNVRWDGPALHMHDVEDSCTDSDCEWAGTDKEVK